MRLAKQIEQLKANYHIIDNYWNVVRRIKRDAARQDGKGRPQKEFRGRVR